MYKKHLFIPDTQVRPGDNLDFLYFIGKYILDQRPDVIVHAGDHADMPSLSSYDIGKKKHEGARYKKDIDAAQEGMEALTLPMAKYNKMRARNKKAQYTPDMHITLGNHENRIVRAVESDAKLEHAIGINDLNYEVFGWKVHEFLYAIEIDGILYSHYFPRNAQGRIVQTYRGAPSARAQVAREHQSCTSGHLQGLDFAVAPTNKRILYGMIAGSCYEHEEDYLSPQGTQYWRGVVVKHEVKDGHYNPMFVSLKYLREKYSNV